MSKLRLSLDKNRVHEVRTKDFGYALASINLPNPPSDDTRLRMSALVVAVPDGDNWSIVAIHDLPI